ncbi:MAG: hypothetical protein CBC09_04420 [Cellvibrionales bacterium TMED49]|nr:hypothetical protein [Porticoccaceae bacterium]OUU38866.1 MAG: hypothetical protein CBC09_04420 [Cellvibrionales bacterium TMED49]
MRKGLFFFVTMFVIDIYLLINISDAVGPSLVVLWLFFSSCFAIYLIKWQGLRGVKLARHTIEKRQLPENAIFTSMLVFCSGVLLLLPGLLTDFFGIVLLMPNVQSVCVALIQRTLASWVISFSVEKSTNSSSSSVSTTSTQVIEGEFVEVDDQLR